MTEAQKNCVKSHNCPRDRKSPEARECKKKAFEACGVTKTQWKEHQSERRAERKERPDRVTK
jgi:hypothetical protein